MVIELPIRYNQSNEFREVIIENPLKSSLLIMLLFFLGFPLIIIPLVGFGDISKFSILGKIIIGILYYGAVLFSIYFFYTPNLTLRKNLNTNELIINQIDYLGIKRRYRIKENQNPTLIGQWKFSVIPSTPLEGYKRRVRPFMKYKDGKNENKILLIPHRPYLIYSEIFSNNALFDLTKKQIEQISKFLGIKLIYKKITGSWDYLKVLNE